MLHGIITCAIKTQTAANQEGQNVTLRTVNVLADGKTQAINLHKTAANKALVQQFTQQVLVEQHLDAVNTYFNGDYLAQYNPHMGDGVAEFLETRQGWAAQGMPAQYDRLHLVLGEGNFVLALSEGK